jgi:predicted DsbA family dithiol-disulfide isomerase
VYSACSVGDPDRGLGKTFAFPSVGAELAAMHAVEIDVWSDYVCPFCALAGPALERLQGELGARLLLRWRAFELRPEPVPPLDEQRERFRGLFARGIVPRARELGLVMRFPAKHPRTRRAHELTAYAATQGRADGVHHLLMREFWEHGRDLGEVDVLADLAARAGLDAEEARAVLVMQVHHDEVLADEAEAADLGLGGVPAILVRPARGLIGEAEVIEGAQPYEVIRSVVDGIVARAE